jgi:hypothetical protein
VDCATSPKGVSTSAGSSCLTRLAAGVSPVIARLFDFTTKASTFAGPRRHPEGPVLLEHRFGHERNRVGRKPGALDMHGGRRD